MADILTPQSGTPRSVWQRAFNRISAKHFDFVLCNKETLKPAAVIELDDRSHRRKDRAQRDVFLDSAAQSAGLTLLHVPVQGSYELETLKTRISQALG